MADHFGRQEKKSGTHEERSLNQLRDQLSSLKADIGNINLQLERAEARARNGGVPVDLNWQAKALHAKKCREIDAAELEALIQRKERSAELVALRAYADAFVAAAQRNLPPDIFRKIDLEAKSETDWPEPQPVFDLEQQRKQKRRERALQKLRNQQQSAPPQVIETVDEVSVSDKHFKTAEKMCRVVRDMLDLYRGGEQIPSNYYGELNEILYDWESGE